MWLTVLLSIFTSGGLVAALVRFWPERENLTVEAAQKAVRLMRESMEEIGVHLDSAHAKIEQLEAQLDAALGHARELERALAAERRKVAQLEQRLRELGDRQDALDR